MTLLYVYTADVYLFAMLFSVLSVYALYKIKPQKLAIIISIISFILTLSTYQSYIGITVGLILMVSVKRLLSQENTAVETVKEIIFRAVIIVISALLYLVLTKIILAMNNIEMSTYG